MSDPKDQKPGQFDDAGRRTHDGQETPNEVSPTLLPPPREGGKRRRWGIWVVIIILVLIGYAVYHAKYRNTGGQGGRGGPGGRGAAMAGKPMPVMVGTAVKGDINVVLSALGNVTPVNNVTVKTRVDGQLVRLAFTEGQTVKAGDLLAEVDPRTYQAQLAQAEGQLARDQALLQNAKLDLQRYQTLLSQDSISKQQVDTQAALVRQYDGTVKLDQGNVDNARVQLSYTRITAPVSGRVGLRQVDPGNIVHASDTNGIVVITQIDPITVIYSIPEDSLPKVMPRLQSGDKLPVEAWDRGQTTQLARGVLMTVDNTIDNTTGTVKLRAQFPNQNAMLFPNQFVNVRMRVDTLRDAVIVPSAAIQRGTQGTFVYVIGEDNKVALRVVKLGVTEGERVSVAQGLQPGERVVIDGADKLRDGSPVEVIQPGAAAASAPAAGQAHQGGRHRRGQGGASAPAASAPAAKP
ncbi:MULTISPECIES: MdtA/MuxA family multidrug efflux RND transporter periplasmic adaptor subunit [Ralstonia]|uniref:MdtA/MuxA family multidrug efflux RND transporter periplasmic adaptor subunit n=1 Tax=Ralstonia mojiangensis TaxID=2953895 RepID=A0ABT2LAT4_9RALS|nr:MdtA/MuxA family multidrug efflux RND transporter periplasmic adaptor subunit [Ralstonia mojiangensis]MCO5414265.1 MdtA/MuxA family multidrug efflux RND transporter periplasmic adaptor subunit [Ralstonia mojiangensis]MCT7298201.1 MdtA/MuxA family multidrug efflux RND transporter periplasmic adaptor subunit [Ralstonia mojiangensis]MCT7312540.1 MdtA/MuxA family multidrug efflux RND transporter periplasmic adaptor subunit [Ralstonia mojiangensis]